MSPPPRERGQASVEFVALLPLLVLLALGLVQGALYGYSAWSAQTAARAGARAVAVGEDPGAPVRRSAPIGGARARIRTTDEAVRVDLPVPRVLPVPVGRVSGRAHLEPQG